jgi:hypothetical protein
MPIWDDHGHAGGESVRSARGRTDEWPAAPPAGGDVPQNFTFSLLFFTDFWFSQHPMSLVVGLWRLLSGIVGVSAVRAADK